MMMVTGFAGKPASPAWETAGTAIAAKVVIDAKHSCFSFMSHPRLYSYGGLQPAAAAGYASLTRPTQLIFRSFPMFRFSRVDGQARLRPLFAYRRYIQRFSGI